MRHFAGRYMTDPSWNSPLNIYGRGNQTSEKLFKEKWSDPVPWLSHLPATLEATEPLSFDLSVKATILISHLHRLPILTSVPVPARDADMAVFGLWAPPPPLIQPAGAVKLLLFYLKGRRSPQ